VEKAKGSEVQDTHEAIDKDLVPARDELKGLKARVDKALDFPFESPFKGFDRTKVKGRIARLAHIVGDADKFATALEVCCVRCSHIQVTAGGKLFHVVTEDVATGKALLEKGKLNQRATIIPLSGVNPRPADASVLKAATTGKDGEPPPPRAHES
jgi:structural maintenance of chromosome 2